MTNHQNVYLLEEFRTQRECITGMAKLNVVIFSILKKHDYLDSFTKIVDDVEQTIYKPVKGFRFRFRLAYSCIESALTGFMSYCKQFVPNAHRCRKRATKTRQSLEELGCFKVTSREGHRHGQNPPALLSNINLAQCLRVFQALLIRFNALREEAIAKGNKVLELPKHQFSLMRDIFRAWFRVNIKKSLSGHPETQDEFTELLENDEIEALEEKAIENKDFQVAIAHRNLSAIDAELANAYVLHKPPQLIERLRREYEQMAEILGGMMWSRR